MAAPQPHTAAVLPGCLLIAFVVLYPLHLVSSVSHVRLSYYLEWFGLTKGFWNSFLLTLLIQVLLSLSSLLGSLCASLLRVGVTLFVPRHLFSSMAGAPLAGLFSHGWCLYG